MSDSKVTDVRNEASARPSASIRGRLDDRLIWQILATCFIVLLPVLAFPFGQDHSTFVRGGREILSGGTLYVDFIDVKPPFIYIFFGILDFLSGGSVVLVRLWEVVYQLAAIGLLVRIMQGCTQQRLWLWGTAISYAVIYSVLGYSQIGQTETFCAMPIVVALWCSLQTTGSKRWLILGAAMTAACLLKYTLAAIGPAVFFVWLTRDGLRASWRPVVAAMLAWLAFSALALTPFLLQDGFLDGMRTSFDYLRVYSSEPPLGLPFIVGTAKALGFFFGYNGSTVMTIATFLGVAALLIRRFTKLESSLVVSALVMMVVLGITIIIERKFSPYHFARLYIPMAILTGASIALWPLVRERFVGLPRDARWILYLSAAFMLLALSPLPRYGNVVQLALRSIGDTRAYDAYLTRPELPGFDFTAIRALKNDLDKRLVRTDSLFMMSMMATPILPQLPTPNTSSFVDSHLYFGVGAPRVWREVASRELRSADWLIVDTIDACEGVNLHPRTSAQSLHIDPLMLPIVQEHFTAVDTVACFIIYKRNRD